MSRGVAVLSHYACGDLAKARFGPSAALEPEESERLSSDFGLWSAPTPRFPTEFQERLFETPVVDLPDLVRSPVYFQADMLLTEGIAQMRRLKTDIVLVKGGGDRVLGIITQADLLRRAYCLPGGSAAVLEMRLGDFVEEKRRYDTIGEDDTPLHAMQQMDVAGRRHIVVSSKPGSLDEVSGTIAQADICRHVLNSVKEFLNRSSAFAEEDRPLIRALYQRRMRQVSAFLSREGYPPTGVIVSPDSSLQQCLDMFRMSGAGAAVVVVKEVPRQVFTERTLVDLVGLQSSYSHIQMGAVATPLTDERPRSLQPKDFLYDALDRMAVHRLHHIIVSEQGKFKGIFSHKHICRYLFHELSSEIYCQSLPHKSAGKSLER